MKAILLTVLGASFLQGCIVYEDSMFAGSDGGTGGDVLSGAGGITSATGGVSSGTGAASAGGTGGALGTGGATSGTGGEATGGVSTGGGTTGGASAGGSASGGSGTGGAACTSYPKTNEDLSAYTIQMIDTFSTEWRFYSNDVDYSGSWYAGGDGSGSGLEPNVIDLWTYTDIDCSAAKDRVLHVTGSGYTAWGVSYDATLMITGTVDASTYTGVTFLGRSELENGIMLSFKDSIVVSSVNTPQKKLTTDWVRYFVPFPAIDKTKLKTVSIVGLPALSHDFMIDDFALYK